MIPYPTGDTHSWSHKHGQPRLVQNMTTYFQMAGVPAFFMSVHLPLLPTEHNTQSVTAFKYHYQLVLDRHFGPKTEKVRYECPDWRSLLWPLQTKWMQKKKVRKCAHTATILSVRTVTASRFPVHECCNWLSLTKIGKLAMLSKATDKYILNTSFHFLHEKHVRVDIHFRSFFPLSTHETSQNYWNNVLSLVIFVCVLETQCNLIWIQ
jgi:hypothetical protein